MGMGLLLAAVFVPLDLLAFMAVLGAGLYLLLGTVRYARQMLVGLIGSDS